MATIQDYYLQTLIVQCMELKLKISWKIAAAIKKQLILVIIRLSQNTLIIQRNYHWKSGR